MPIYEYYCEKDDRVFETITSIASRDKPVKCPKCGREAVRIMPTTVATMSRVKGLVERVPFHHADVRTEKKKRTIAPVKPKKEKTRNSDARGKKKKAKKKTKAKG
jgi:putative FmdB family regulatory protein